MSSEALIVAAVLLLAIGGVVFLVARLRKSIGEIEAKAKSHGWRFACLDRSRYYFSIKGRSHGLEWECRFEPVGPEKTPVYRFAGPIPISGAPTVLLVGQEAATALEEAKKEPLSLLEPSEELTSLQGLLPHGSEKWKGWGHKGAAQVILSQEAVRLFDKGPSKAAPTIRFQSSVLRVDWPAAMPSVEHVLALIEAGTSIQRDLVEKARR